MGSDGKWRVACDSCPGARVDALSLGLALTIDEKLARNRHDKATKERLRAKFWMLNIVETKE